MTDSGGRKVGTTAATPVDPASTMRSSLGSSWRRPDIQGLRAIAVLSVIAFHAELPVPGGFTGVDVFFVISGYVITLLLLREHSKGTLSFATFYARRAQRLLPALAVMVAVIFVLSWLVQSPFGAQQTTSATGIGAMLLIANVVIVRSVGDYFDAAAESNPLLHTWSLSVEEQFYLVFPVVLVLVLTRFRHKWGLLGTVGALTLVGFVLSVALTAGWSPWNLTSQPEAWAFYLSPSRAWEFGVGALLAIVVTRHNWAPTVAQSRVLSVIGLVLLAASFWLITPTSPFPGTLALLPVTGTAVLIAAGLASNPVSHVLASRPAVLVGDWSYSLYLWHWPIIVFALLLWPGPATAVVAAVISFIPALLSYRYLENPIRRMSLTRRQVGLAGVAVSTLVVVLGVVLSTLGPRTIPGVREFDEQRKAQGLSSASECFVQGEFTPSALERCWFRTDDSSGWVLLAGDSHAAHLLDGLVPAAGMFDLDVFSVTGGACPFVRVSVPESDVTNCDELNGAVWDLIDGSDPPAAVVLGEKGVPGGLAETLDELDARGIPAVFVRDVPRWAPVDQRVQTLPCRGGAITFNCLFSLDETERFSKENRAQEDELLRQQPGLVALDPWPLFCDGEGCSPVQSGRLEYVDNEHLNRFGSQRLTPTLVSALDRVIK